MELQALTEVEELFAAWRGGNAQAGQSMAQQFSDWFYAISTSRLGDQHGRAPLERACKNFLEGIPQLEDPGELVGWAHNLVLQEIDAAGARVSGGDFANALTGDRKPSELLRAAKGGLSDNHVKLIAMSYGATAEPDELIKEAEAQGGMPYAILEARYALKRWLKDNANVRFSVVKDKPPLDYGPLPLYEAALLVSQEEEEAMEQWFLHEKEVCKDVAEFATFALALRAGAFGGEAVSDKPVGKKAAGGASTPAAGDDEDYEAHEGTSGKTKAAIGIAAVGIALIAIVFIIIAIAVLIITR